MSVIEDDWKRNFEKWRSEKEKPRISTQNHQQKVLQAYQSTTSAVHPPNKKVKIIIFIIPVLIILFIIYNNFIASHEFTYFYDIGSDNYLSPQQRISETKLEETSYRELKESLVYFSVPIARGSEKVSVKVRFKDYFPEKGIFNLGAKDQEVWHYEWKVLYNPALSELNEFSIDKGLYKINNKLENFSVEELKETTGFVIGTNLNLPNIPVIGEDYKGESIINTSLRGGHVFYIYTGENLSIGVKKQDLNWYNGSDELEISVLDLNNNLLENLTISDDGIEDVNKSISNIQPGSLEYYGLPEGIYRLEFSDFDGLIREIKINTKKIVVFERVYLADSIIFFPGIEKESHLYTEFFRNGDITFKTWHDKALQVVYVNDIPINIKQRSNESTFDASEGFYEVKSQKNDIIVTAPGYFAFSEDSYFEPFENRVLQLKNDKEWIKNNLDYLVLNYHEPIKDSNWLIGETEFVISDLYVKDNKLNFVFNAPHLSQDESSNSTIPIDWVEIKVYKKGILK